MINIADIVGELYTEMVTGIATDELVAVSQDRDSIRPNDNKTICNYLNIIRLSNKPSLMEYWLSLIHI